MIGKRKKKNEGMKRAAAKGKDFFKWKPKNRAKNEPFSYKRITAFFIAVILLVSSIPAFADWEDGLIIPGQGGTINGWEADYDYDLPYEDTAKDSPTIGNNNIIDVFPSTEENSSNNANTSTEKRNTNETTFLVDAVKQEDGTTEDVQLSNNYEDLFGSNTAQLLSVRSQTGSGPYDYLNGNKGTITIVADKLLSNILYYENGEVASNIHIAKWIKGDPAALEYPAYCKDPEYHGVAQYPDKQYGIKPAASLTEKQKTVLGIVRSGYPFKSPSDLGVQDVDEAYYATLGAMQTALIGGSLDKWSIRSGNEERNTRILNALKSIYNTGVANPYTPPAISVKLAPVSGSEKGTVDGEWVTNEYVFSTDYPYNYWKLQFAEDKVLGYINSGTVEVNIDGMKIMPQENINGSWDTIKGFKIPAGKNVVIKYKKSVADSTGAKFAMYGSICDVDFENCFTYLGDSVEAGWQGYCYNTVPYATDTANYLYDKSNNTDDGTNPPNPPDPDDPDNPSTKGEGSLVVEKLDWMTKEKAADAVFHIRGVSDSCSYINISVKASSGATVPILGNGASISVSDGVIKLTGIPAGTYEITEVSPPPFYDAAVGQNSQSVEVVNDAEVHPKVTFENKPYGSLTIVKTGEDGTPLAGVYFKVVNHTTGFEQTVVTDTTGKVEIPSIPEGSYECVELATRMDYILNDTPVIGEVDWGQETTVTVTNKAKPSIEILKIDAETSEPIPNVAFEIKHKNSQQTYSMSTGVDGKITLEGVDEGWFEVKEITPAPGYIASDEVHEVYAESGKPGSITIKNTKRSGIVIEKVDIDGKPLAGVSFHIYNFGGVTPIPNSPVTTNEQGIANLDNLNPGHYQVQEVAALSGYLLDTKKYDLIVEEGAEKTTRLKIVNKRLPNLTVKKVDTAEVDKGLAGAVFEVKEVDGTALQGSPYTTGADGTFTIESIDLGTKGSKKLVITEIQPPPGYNLSNPTVQYATMEPDKDILLTFSNAKLPELVIRKIDSQTSKPLPGAVFSVEKLEEPKKGFLTGSPFTTDQKGEIHLPNQGTGSYKIVEQKASPNYIVDTAERIINLKEGEDFTAVFENTKKPSLIVHKVDSITKSPLPGAEFLVTRAVNDSLNGETVEIGKYYSDANGRFSLNFVEPGWYRILETHPAAGYQEVNNYYQDVFLSAGEDKEITFENTAKSAIIIRKVDLETGEALPNIRFQVRYLSGATGSEGTIIGVYTTSLNGSVVVAGLKPGVYSIAELQADSDHILDDTIQTVTLADDNSVVTVEFTNQPKGGLLIKKYDAVTKEPLSDVIFKITNIKGEVVGESNGEFRTDEKGAIYIPRLMGGFVIQEIKTKDGYILDNTAKTIHIDSGKVFSLEFFNQPENSIIIQKLNAKDNTPLAGATIRVTTADDKFIAEEKTDVSGMFTVSGVKPGKSYKIQEIIAPEGFQIDSDVKVVTVQKDKPTKIVLYNQPLISLTIQKLNAVTKEPLANAKIKVTTVDDKFIAEERTDASGMITVSGLIPGESYKIFETEAPEGFLLDGTVKTVKIKANEPNKIELFNSPLNTLVIKKLDLITKEPIEGVKIRVSTIEDTLIGEYVTDERGMITVTGLKSDKILKVLELEAKEGYQIDSTVKFVTIKQNEPAIVELFNAPLNTLVIHKMDGTTKESLSGVKIKVTTPEGALIGEYQTDVEGKIIISGLKPGIVKVQEQSTKEEYLLDDTIHEVKIETGNPAQLDLYNYKKASLIIIKQDATDKKKLLEGAKFKVSQIDGKIVGEYTTGENGQCIVPSLSPNWYVVEEVGAPKNYAISSKPQNVQAKANDPTTVIFEDYQNATLRIEKTDKVTGKSIENVEFSITRSDGKTYGKYKTDKRGEINLEYQLPAGTYLVRETQTVKGYALDTNIRKVSLNWGDDKLIEWENYPLASLEIEKTDKENGKAIAGVKFTLYDKNNKEVGEYITDSKGRITLDKMLAGDSIYYIEEKETKEGYIPNPGKQTVKTKWGKITRIEVENQPIMGYVKVHKTAADNNPITGILKGRGLAGAEFTIYDSDGKKVDVLITDSLGYAKSEKLRFGDYTMKETKVPLYYLDENETIEFKIEKDGETVEIERENKSTILQTNIEKSGYKEVLAGDTIRYDLFNIQNKSVVPLSNFYLHESIPSDATRITRLFTGTYNQNLNYTIYYKTNKNKTFKILKDNLFSDRVYEIDCTQGLQAGEFVTDIKFEFGTVDVGFREVERPFLYCKVNDNLPNGYQFTNHAEVGGTYEMQKVKAEDNFTTKVFAPKPENKGKLPRTGY